MRLELVPAPDPDVAAAVERGIAALALDLEGRPPAYTSAWLRTGLLEAADRGRENGAGAAAYAFSPRRTRGATRA